MIRSTPGVRSDLFARPLDQTRLTDFFGGVSQVELCVGEDVGGAAGAPGEEEKEDARRDSEEKEDRAVADESGSAALQRPARPPRARRRRALDPLHASQQPAHEPAGGAATSRQASHGALAAAGAVGLLHAGGALLGQRKGRREG